MNYFKSVSFLLLIICFVSSQLDARQKRTWKHHPHSTAAQEELEPTSSTMPDVKTEEQQEKIDQDDTQAAQQTTHVSPSLKNQNRKLFAFLLGNQPFDKCDIIILSGCAAVITICIGYLIYDIQIIHKPNN